MTICSACNNLVPDIGGHNCTRPNFKFTEPMKDDYARGFRDGWVAATAALSPQPRPKPAETPDAQPEHKGDI